MKTPHQQSTSPASDETHCSAWRPIETAPKDGFHILLYRPEIVFVGYYGGPNSGWRHNAPGLDAVWPLPTHWMPLPDFPQNAPSAGTAPESATSNPVESHGGPIKSDPPEGAVGLPRLVLRFLAGEWVRRYCGIGDRANEMNWLHVRWLGPQSYRLPVLWWGFGSAMIDERIVFQILQHPEEWEISSQNSQDRAREA